MSDENCLFCQIVQGKVPSVKVEETAEFIIIKNKYPRAPIHLLIVDKVHREKRRTLLSGEYPGYWTKMMAAAAKVIRQLGLDKTGYKLVNNGAGYNHFEHEHLHILGGSLNEPGGRT